MSTIENRQLLQYVFAELSQGNGRPLLASLADDVRWTVIGTTKFSGTRIGKQAVKTELLAAVGAQLDGPVIFQYEQLIAEDDHVVIQAQGKATAKNGKPYNNRYCIVARFVDGKIQEITEFIDTELLTAALCN